APVGELVLEQAAVELVAVERRDRGAAPLDAPRDVAVVPGRHEEAQARLDDLVVLEVVAQAADLGEVVRADLHGRLPDLERGQGRRTLALLGDDDRHVRTGALELERQGQPGETSSENRYVVPITHASHLT